MHLSIPMTALMKKVEKAEESKFGIGNDYRIKEKTMIQIDNVDRIGYGYHFPTIDFKFQNTGSATAFLWQFAIKILHAEIDPTPTLDFKANVEGDALNVGITNFGW